MIIDVLAATVTSDTVAELAPLVGPSRERGRGVGVPGEMDGPDDVARTTEASPQSSSVVITYGTE